MLESTRTGGRRIGHLTRLTVIGVALVGLGASCTSNRADTGASTTNNTAGSDTTGSDTTGSDTTGSDSASTSAGGSNASSGSGSDGSTDSAATLTSPSTQDEGSETDATSAISPTSTPATPESTTTTAAPTTTVPPTTTTTTIVTAGAIVIVANATDVPGGAGQMSELLGRAGFQMAAPTDAGGNEEYRDTSQVYVKPGSEAVAGSVALLLGNVPVNYMPTPAPITDATVGLGDASVLVMLGRDLAGTTPPELANR